MSLQPPVPKTRSVSPLVAGLRSRRLALGITQVAMARQMNRDPQCLCDWESGKQDPSLRNLENWCAAFGLQLGAIDIENEIIPSTAASPSSTNCTVGA